MSESRYDDLIVWRKAMDYTVNVYGAAGRFPKEEQYGLAAQLRRSAVSIPSNIAEGKGRNGNKEFRQFLYQARGSLVESETQIRLARRLGYLSEEDEQALRRQVEEIGKLLNGLINSLRV